MSTSDRERRARDPRSRVSATEAAKNFGRLVDRVREEHVTYVIERGGKPVARIAPIERATFTIADFKRLMASLPRLEDPYLRAVEHAVVRHSRPRVRRNPWER
jgi:prevent-host-death family protein